MDLTQLANLGEFVGGIAVSTTLVYVAVQARHARRQLKEQSVSSVMETLMTSFVPVYFEATAPVFRRGLYGEELTDPDDQYVFYLLMHRQAAGLLMCARTRQEMGGKWSPG
jgi:hypothetical protein